MKNEGALSKRFFRHTGIYRSDVSSLLLNLGQSTAFRSGPGQALGRAGRTRPAHRRDEFRPAIPQRVARQHCPSLLHRQNQIKSIAASKGIIYHRTVNSLLTGCLTERDKFNDDLTDGDYVRWCKDWIKECCRTLKPGGALFLYNLPNWNILLGAHLARISHQASA